MTRSVLVSAMMAGARQRAADTGGALAADPELISYIDQAYGLYYGTLVEADPAFYQVKTTFVTVAGTEGYALPAAWWGTMHLGILIGGHYSKLERLNVDEVFDYPTNGRPRKYQIEGGQIALYPTPDAVYTLKHIYVPVWTALTAGAQAIDGLLGNEELIELEAAIRLKEKEEADVSGLVAKRDMALTRLMKQSFQRNVVDAQVAGESFIDDGPLSTSRTLRDDFFE